MTNNEFMPSEVGDILVPDDIKKPAPISLDLVRRMLKSYGINAHSSGNSVPDGICFLLKFSCGVEIGTTSSEVYVREAGVICGGLRVKPLDPERVTKSEALMVVSAVLRAIDKAVQKEIYG